VNGEILMRRWAKRSGLSIKEARRLTFSFLENLADALSHEDEVEIVGFGTYRVVHPPLNRPMDPFGNPTQMQEGLHLTVRFKAGLNLRRVVSAQGKLKLARPLKIERKEYR
jgi:nucleoid DNA-binding protein